MAQLSSPSTSRAERTPLLEQLWAPVTSDLARPCKIKRKPPVVKERHIGGAGAKNAGSNNPTSVSPQQRVRKFPSEPMPRASASYSNTAI